MRYDNPEPGKYQLLIRAAENAEGGESVLTSGPKGQALFSPARSPDGKTIVCVEVNVGNALGSLVAVDVDGGRQHLFFGGNERLVELPTWLPDGSGLLGLMHGQNTDLNRSQIAFVSYPEGKLSPITHDTNDYSDLSVAANGHVLSTILSEARWSLYLMPASTPSSQARPLISTVSDTNFTWTPDGQLIGDQGAVLNRIDPATGSKATIVTEEGKPSGNPSACAYGRFIVFELLHLGSTGDDNIWRIDSSGGNLKQLTSGKHDHHAMCSPDSRWVYYIEERDEGKLARVSMDGGAPQILSDLPIPYGAVDLSPDGKLAAFVTLEHSGEHREMLALMDTGSGKAAKVTNFERPHFGLLGFARDGKGVVYSTRENGVDNLWLQPLDGSKGRRITDFTSERIYDFHWSFDGNQLALVRGHTDADVVLINQRRRP